jgi:beta-lactamase class D
MFSRQPKRDTLSINVAVTLAIAGVRQHEMRQRTAILLCGILGTVLLASCRTFQIEDSAAKEAFGTFGGTLVVIDCSSGRITTYRPDVAKVPLPPCSTFKIVNSLIGLETGIVSSPDEQFFRWDGVERSLTAWNRDLSFREAFEVSCVPAFQNLARKIGQERMQGWLDKIGYGNRDISAGIDVFWLPSKGRNTIMISPAQQAELMRSIVSCEVPFSEASLATLKRLMFIKKTDRGILYGKTGSGTDDDGTFVLGWFAGYAESNGKTHAFACVAQGRNVMSKNARAIVENVMEKQGVL